MPLDAGLEKSKLTTRKEIFQDLLGKMAEVDFSAIVRYVQREDKNHWTEDKALSELENFKAFFALRGVAKFPIVPTKDIDEVWHACILHTEFYIDLCTSLHGKYVHHRPSDGMTESKTSSRINFKKTAAIFGRLTGRPYVVGTHGAKCCSNCSNVLAKASDCGCGACGGCDAPFAKPSALAQKADAKSYCNTTCSTCECY